MPNDQQTTGEPGGCSARPACSALTVEQMITRLATRGLFPCEHNLTVWQHADGSGWGASVDGALSMHREDAEGETLEDALANLMRRLNRGADVEPNS